MSDARRPPRRRPGRPPADDPADERLIVRVTGDELAAYDRAAESVGLKRSAWVRRVLNRAATHATKKP